MFPRRALCEVAILSLPMADPQNLEPSPSPDLPRPILTRILMYCTDAITVCRASRISVEWHKAATEPRVWWWRCQRAYRDLAIADALALVPANRDLQRKNWKEEYKGIYLKSEAIASLKTVSEEKNSRRAEAHQRRLERERQWAAQSLQSRDKVATRAWYKEDPRRLRNKGNDRRVGAKMKLETYYTTDA